MVSATVMVSASLSVCRLIPQISPMINYADQPQVLASQ